MWSFYLNDRLDWTIEYEDSDGEKYVILTLSHAHESDVAGMTLDLERLSARPNLKGFST
jgi:hypothetical protein